MGNGFSGDRKEVPTRNFLQREKPLPSYRMSGLTECNLTT